MANKKKFVFLSKEFYQAYPSVNYPEMEQKHNRPYIQLYVKIDEIQYAIPLRSGINHTHVLWTDRKNHCGVDFSKAVVITDEKFIDLSINPHIRQEEFNALRGKDYKIKTKMQKYIEDYKNAKNNLNIPRNRQLVKFSTLQYFENELGI